MAEDTPLAEQFSLAGKVALVTGAGRGLGAAMARALAEAGASVVCAARTEAQIEAVAADLRAAGHTALALPVDVSRVDSVDALVERALAALGRLDILVANAGGGGPTGGLRIEETTDEAWRATLDLNLSSVFFCARAVLPALRRQGGGTIITVASGTGLRGDPRNWAYATAKAGVIAFTRSLAVQYARDGVRANCIVPGFIAQRPPATDEEAAVQAQRGRFIPAGRVGRAEELGPLAVFLASDASRYITGERFVIDGGGLAGGAAPWGWQLGE